MQQEGRQMNASTLLIDMVHQDVESFENQWALKVKFLITDLGYLAPSFSEPSQPGITEHMPLNVLHMLHWNF